ncbi:glycosyltransferase family 2 protein [Rhabdobacter roseus]|uniref:glycosyltransferase family 2 protein n=1 Tax=Rhabdobacter roseus TaxID=1655419 RepID=UPI00160DDF29|nr:glycosyltransferase family 2 protein [Rhabdobacter roseus]
MRLSIITINLNNSAGLRKTIESVINQTSTEFEYLIIDGDSTDGSIGVIKEYASKIAYWVSEPDGGIYQAMNKGIQMAKGEYCQFLNSGDWLISKDTTSQMLNVIENEPIIVGHMVKELTNGKLYFDRRPSSQKVTMLTFFRGTINHSPAYIRRSLFDTYGLYDETLRIVSDWKWYLIVVGLNNVPVIFCNIDVTRFDMTGISSTSKVVEQQERKKVLSELLPPTILADYQAHWKNIDQARRINRYKIPRFFFKWVDKLLNKWEKYR